MDLTGTFTILPKKGLYYLRQVGDKIWWLGEPPDSPKIWANVAYGTITDNVIKVHWADVPMGTNRGVGTLDLAVSDGGNTLTVTKSSGGFGSHIFKRQVGG